MYKKLIGSNVIVPIYNNSVPVKVHKAVKTDFGTGAMMICSYGDSFDVEIFREMNLKPVYAINEEGLMTEAAANYQGLTVEKARKKIVEDLRRKELIVKETEITQRIPLCERSKTPIELIPMNEWYLKQLIFLDKIREISKQVKFHPEKNRQILHNWMDSLTIDWPISRRRYYATEIPLWYCVKCKAVIVPYPGKYYRPWKEKAPVDKCPACDSTKFVGDERVFDTWMDSSISNLFVCGYKRNPSLFKKSYPTSIRPQGRDIVRTWLFYTLLKNVQLLDSKAFENVWITGMGLDARGRAMHKSLGNIIEPTPVLKKYGADAFRFWAASETNVGDDFRISEDRILGAFKFLTKFWNLARFISSFETVESGELNNTDRWILSELNEVIKNSREGYENFNFFPAATKIREFIWNTFASNYVEMVKNRAYDGDAGALYTLHTCLKTICSLLTPICPFTTDKIYREVYDDTVHKTQLPESKKNWESKLKELTEKIAEFNSNVWKAKKKKGIPLNAEISGIKIPSELKPFEEDLVKMHKLV